MHKEENISGFLTIFSFPFKYKSLVGYQENLNIIWNGLAAEEVTGKSFYLCPINEFSSQAASSNLDPRRA
jgi:hypothetical protein